MARNAKQVPSNGGGNKVDQPTLEPAAYEATVVGVVFVGVQKQRPFKGQVKDPVDEVRITYELSDEFMVDEDGKELEDKPRWFTESIPFYSLEVERAKSSKRYAAIDPQDESDGDFSQLIGKPCQILIVNNPGKGKHEGRVFENIGDVMAASKRQRKAVVPLVNPSFYYDAQDDECTLEEFRALPEFVQEIIKKADDFTTSVLHRQLNGGDSAPAAEPEQAQADDADQDGIY